MPDSWVEEYSVFQAALELEFPWYVRNYKFDHENGRLDIWLGFRGPMPLTCSVCQTPEQPYYDIDKEDQVWRHLDFWKYKTFLHAPHPRVSCSCCEKVKYAHLPWTRYHCSFTLEFERWVLQLVKEMPVKPASRLVREHDTRLWRIVHFYVDQALKKQDLSDVHRIAVDETSSRRGHQYVTVVVDSDTRKVVFATEGKDRQTIQEFSEHLSNHHGTPDQIREYCSDMSAAFLAGMKDQFPSAQQTIDKFHVMKLLGDAVDETRRKEQRSVPELKKTRYLWLRHERDLTVEQKDRLASLSTTFLKTAKAYQLKVAFQEFWSSSVRVAPLHMKIWYGWAMRSKVPDMMKAAETIRKHAVGILHWFESRMTNGLSEAVNGLIQAAKRRARGYRTTRNLIAMIYMIGANLQLS
ncbi:MAG: ISL3 family transposase [Alicyclobacillaceae bacterium]|nr:ISL3 family transposase [Alicyclobacillaceae bacterium]